MQVIYHARENETITSIVENTAEIVLEPSDADPDAALKAVRFVDGTVVYLDQIRTHWFLARQPQ